MLACKRPDTDMMASQAAQPLVTELGTKSGLPSHAGDAAEQDTKVVVLVGKGGGGKTTTAVNLACAAKMLGHRVALIDMDPSKSAAEWREARSTPDIPVRSCPPGQLTPLVEKARKAKLSWLVVDTAPELNGDLAAAVRLADVVLLPTRPAGFDLTQTKRRVELIKANDRPFGIVLNAAPPRRAGQDAPLVFEARRALKGVGGRLWVGQITQRHSVIYALARGQGVVEADPDGLAAAEYKALWSAIVWQVNRRTA